MFSGYNSHVVNNFCFAFLRLRHGRAGGSWRHVKEVLQAGGSRIVFVDGKLFNFDGSGYIFLQIKSCIFEILRIFIYNLFWDCVLCN